MALSYLLAPIPKWVIVGNDGLPAGGAKLYTYRSLNKTEPKAVFQDPGGTIPWSNPVIFDLNGTQGPFYWEVDSAALSETYYLEAYDSDGNLLWTVDDFFPPGTGGGGNVTTYIPILNYITNNQFINHIDDTANPTATTNLVIAPSNHKGFTPALITPIVGTYGVVGPDIRFVKNNTAATDQISFPVFPLATAPLTGDVTPVDYVRYQCTNSPAGEQYKSFQFPITQKVKNLSNQAMTFGVWGAVAATPVTLSVYVRQYFGSGTAASADTRTLVGTIDLTTTWDWYPISLTIPSVAGKSLGTPGLQTDDDALYIQLEMPLGAPCDVFFTKPALFLGNIDPDLEFDSYDQIDSINSTPRTGDVKTGYLTSAPLGWVAMNDGTIGNVGTGATTRANQDTFQLYKTIWDGVLDAFAPVSGGRGGSAVADFLAGKTLQLPATLGRSLASTGLGAVLGQYAGANQATITLAAANIPAHTHTTTVPVQGVLAGFGYASGTATGLASFVSNGGQSIFGVPLTEPPTAFVVPTLPFTTFTNFYIKL